MKRTPAQIGPALNHFLGRQGAGSGGAQAEASARACSIQLSRAMRPPSFRSASSLSRLRRRQRGELPVMEDAAVVQLLHDLRTDARKLGEIVGRAARRRQKLEGFDRRLAGDGLGRFKRRLDRRRLRLAEIDARGALAARNAVDRRPRDQIAIKRDGAARVVIGGNGMRHAVRIAVRVEDRDDGNLEAIGLLDRQRFLIGVDDENQVGRAAHVLDAAKRLLELVALSREQQTLFLGDARGARAQHFVELAQALNRAGNRLPIGQRAAEPAGVDEILRAALGGVGDLVLRLALGADEQHAAALGHRVGHDLERLMQQRHGLGEIDDVDIVASAENIGRHLRVPAMRLVAEMSAGLEEATHGEFRKRHLVFSPVRPRRKRLEGRRIGHRNDVLKQTPQRLSPVGWGAVYARCGRGASAASERRRHRVDV